MKPMCRMTGPLPLTLFVLSFFCTDANAAAAKDPAYLGVSVENLSRKEKEEMKASFGVRIAGVEKDSPAEKAGILEDDVIQYYGKEKIRTTGDLITRVRESAPDTTVQIKLVRKGLVKEMAVKVGKRESGWGERRIRLKDGGNKAWLGVRLHGLNDDLAGYFRVNPDEGALILQVEGKSPAEKAGLKAGDVIVRIGKEKVYEPGDVTDILRDFKPGDKIEVAVIRQGRETVVQAELEKGTGPLRLLGEPFSNGLLEYGDWGRWDLRPNVDVRIRDGGGRGDADILIRKEFDETNKEMKENIKEIEIRAREIGEKAKADAEEARKNLQRRLITVKESAEV